MKRQILDWWYMGNMLLIPTVQSSSDDFLQTQTPLPWHWNRFIPPIWFLIVALVQEERQYECQMLRSRKTTEMHWSVFTPSPGVNKSLHFSTRGKQQVGKQWTANLALRKWWQDLVKITRLMMTFTEHLANAFTQCMVMDVRKISMAFVQQAYCEA